MQIKSIGIDLGKTTFHVVALDSRCQVVVRKKFLPTTTVELHGESGFLPYGDGSRCGVACSGGVRSNVRFPPLGFASATGINCSASFHRASNKTLQQTKAASPKRRLSCLGLLLWSYLEVNVAGQHTAGRYYVDRPSSGVCGYGSGDL